jgi:uncharacterized membrane protein YphA (DoxX/SURF4 family)
METTISPSTVQTNAASAPTAAISKKARIIGWIMSILPALMLLMSAVMKFIPNKQMQEGFTHLGWPMGVAVTLGIVELTCTILYLIPRTTVLGAILLTGYLGGAIATTARVGDGFIPTVIMGIFLWGGLFLRDRRVRALIPMTTRGE